MCDGEWDPTHYLCHKDITKCERIWLPYWQAYIHNSLMDWFDCDTVQEFKQYPNTVSCANTVGILVDDYTQIIEEMYNDNDWLDDLRPYYNELIHTHPTSTRKENKYLYPYKLEGDNNEQWFNYINWFKDNGNLPWEWP